MKLNLDTGVDVCDPICLTDRNIGSYQIYLNTYLVSLLLCGVVSSSLDNQILTII